MIPVADGAVVREADRRTIAFGADEATLIDRAGAGIAAVVARLPNFRVGTEVTVFCGKGNNGADGFAAAFHLNRAGASVKVVPVGELKQHARAFLHRLPRSVRTGAVSDPVPNKALVIDALLGSGIEGEPHGELAAAIQRINGLPNHITAVDVPSGLSGGWDPPEGTHITSDVCVCLTAPRPDVVLNPSVCGDLYLVDVGITLPDPQLGIAEPGDFLRIKPTRSATSHKYTVGKVGIVAGSAEMTGAATLTSRGAVCAGAGLVALWSDPAAVGVARSSLPQLIAENGGVGDALADERLRALIVGPGMGRSDDVIKQVKQALEFAGPLILDADALWALSEIGTSAVQARTHETILTPHPGELRALCGSSTAADARDLAAWSGAVVHLKGGRSVTFSPNGLTVFNVTNGPELSTGGTGDVLSGIVGAFAASGLSAHDATWGAALVHGVAGAASHNAHILDFDRFFAAIPRTINASTFYGTPPTPRRIA